MWELTWQNMNGLFFLVKAKHEWLVSDDKNGVRTVNAGLGQCFVGIALRWVNQM